MAEQVLTAEEVKSQVRDIVRKYSAKKAAEDRLTAELLLGVPKRGKKQSAAQSSRARNPSTILFPDWASEVVYSRTVNGVSGSTKAVNPVLRDVILYLNKNNYKTLKNIMFKTYETSLKAAIAIANKRASLAVANKGKSKDDAKIMVRWGSEDIQIKSETVGRVFKLCSNLLLRIRDYMRGYMHAQRSEAMTPIVFNDAVADLLRSKDALRGPDGKVVKLKFEDNTLTRPALKRILYGQMYAYKAANKSDAVDDLDALRKEVAKIGREGKPNRDHIRQLDNMKIRGNVFGSTKVMASLIKASKVDLDNDALEVTSLSKISSKLGTAQTGEKPTKSMLDDTETLGELQAAWKASLSSYNKKRGSYNDIITARMLAIDPDRKYIRELSGKAAPAESKASPSRRRRKSGGRR